MYSLTVKMHTELARGSGGVSMKALKILFNVLILSFAFLYTIQGTEAKTLHFAVAADVHYSVEQNKDNKNYSDGAKALGGFVSRMNENNYDFVVFDGDNVVKSNEQNLKAFLQVVQNIKTPYYLVAGNRDTHKISGVAKPEYLKLVSRYNKNQKKAEMSYYFYPNSDIIAIVLDGVSTGMPSTHGVFNQKNLKWLDSVLEKNKNKKAIIFQHVPYYEPCDKPSYEILEKAEYTAVLRKHQNVFMIVSGHYHKDFRITDDYGVTHISVPALFEQPYNYTEIYVDYSKKPFSPMQDVRIHTTLKPAV